MDIDRIKAYLLARASESSTWRNLILVLTALGVRIDPDQQTIIISIGLGIAGVIGASMPDLLKRGAEQ